jgi:dTDP-glucose pyrophosphorylase
MIMHDWPKVILKLNDTIQTAIMVLDEVSAESLRIVVIVDENERLIGTVTDGDIRRGLIKRFSMDTAITKIMSTNPIVAFESDDKQQIFSKMKELDVFSIPIIDSDRKIVGIETLTNLLEKNKYDNPVLLMAGGFGERLKPLTEHLPKPLLKLGGKPILEHILEQFIASGFHDFYISIYYKAEIVKKHFGDGGNWNVSIKYIHEEEPLGTAGALGLLPSNLPKLPILVMNGDLLTKIDFNKLLNFHFETGDEATMCVRDYDFQVPYGVIKADGNHIVSIQEKPIQNYFINAGVYVLNQSILDIIDGVNYLDMPQLLEKIIKANGQVNMFPVHEYWLDIGQIEQFDKAQQDSITLFR